MSSLEQRAAALQVAYRRFGIQIAGRGADVDDPVGASGAVVIGENGAHLRPIDDIAAVRFPSPDAHRRLRGPQQPCAGRLCHIASPPCCVPCCSMPHDLKGAEPT